MTASPFCHRATRPYGFLVGVAGAGVLTTGAGVAAGAGAAAGPDIVDGPDMVDGLDAGGVACA
jgi:hypothetical protein